MASDIESKIWYDLVHAKKGDEYLCLYLGHQENTRRRFKVITIAISVAGIVSGYKSLKIPVIVSFAIICAIEIMSSTEYFIIRSDDDMSKLRELRSLYYSRTLDLEKLLDDVRNERISDDDAASQFYKLREATKRIEELDILSRVKDHRRMSSKADKSARIYLNTYYPS